MSNLTTYAANAILNGTTMPATLYLAGHTGNPGATAIANPAAETRRIGFGRDAAADGEAIQDGSGTITNATATEVWTHFSLWDASAGGNAWWIGELSSAVSVIATETIRLNDATITLTLETWS